MLFIVRLIIFLCFPSVIELDTIVDIEKYIPLFIVTIIILSLGLLIVFIMNKKKQLNLFLFFNSEHSFLEKTLMTMMMFYIFDTFLFKVML